GSRRKFARRFAEGIGNLTRNAKGDRRKEDRRICHKIAGGCRSIRDTAYRLLRSLVEHSCINPKSLAFSYLDEKLIDTGLMKFLGLCPFTLSWYLEFAFAFSTSSTPFTTNALPP
ncbi:hypothetical protein BHM03_00062023, partial [Ensete ventricosum]